MVVEKHSKEIIPKILSHYFPFPLNKKMKPILKKSVNMVWGIHLANSVVLSTCKETKNA